MNGLVTTLDDYGKPAWIAATVVGFIVFWPVGLAILAYLYWNAWDVVDEWVASAVGGAAAAIAGTAL